MKKIGVTGAAPGDDAFARTRLLVSAAALGVRQVGVAGITALGVLALSHLLSSAEFAYYGWTMAVVTVAAAVGDLGYAGALIKSGAAVRFARFASVRHRKRVLPVAVAVLAVLAVAPLSGTTKLAAALIVVMAVFLAMQTIPTAVYESEGRFAEIGALELLQRVILIVGAVVIAAAIHRGWASPAAGAVAALVGYVLIARFSGVRSAPAADELDAGFSRAWLTGRIAGQVNYIVYPALATIALTGRDVGLVLWALSVSNFPALGGQLTARILFPAIAARGSKTVEAHLSALRLLLLFAGPLVVAMVVFATPLTVYVFGIKWIHAVTTLRLECVNTLLGVMVMPTVPVLFVYLRPATAAALTVLNATVTWIVAIIFIGPVHLHLIGISIGTMSSNVVVLIAIHVYLRRQGHPGISTIVGPLVSLMVVMAAGLAVAPHITGRGGLIVGFAVMSAIALVAVIPWVWALKSSLGVHAPADPADAPGPPAPRDSVAPREAVG